MMRIFARLVVLQQDLLLLWFPSLVWTCRRSIAVLWPLNLHQVASLIRSKSLPWSDSCQVSSPLFHRRSPCPPLPPRISLNFLLVRIREAELWFTLRRDWKVIKCPSGLAAGSLDSLIGKLHAIYNRLGRFGHVNPVSHSLIKEYLKFTRAEQAGLAVTPKQAVPFFFTKFKSLIGHFRKKIAANASLSLVSKYTLVRDATFFVVDFFTGDRTSD